MGYYNKLKILKDEDFSRLLFFIKTDTKIVFTRAGHSKASTTSDFYSHFLKPPDQHASATIDKIFE